MKRGLIDDAGVAGNSRWQTETSKAQDISDLPFIVDEDGSDSESGHPRYTSDHTRQNPPSYKAIFLLHLKSVKEDIRKDNYDGMWRDVENPVAGLVAHSSNQRFFVPRDLRQPDFCQQCFHEMNGWGMGKGNYYSSSANSSERAALPASLPHRSLSTNRVTALASTIPQSFQTLRSVLASSPSDMLQHSLTAGCLYGYSFTTPTAEVVTLTKATVYGRTNQPYLSSFKPTLACSPAASSLRSASANSTPKRRNSHHREKSIAGSAQPLLILSPSKMPGFKSTNHSVPLDFGSFSFPKSKFKDKPEALNVSGAKCIPKVGSLQSSEAKVIDPCTYWSPYPIQLVKCSTACAPTPQSNLSAVIAGGFHGENTTAKGPSSSILSFWQEPPLANSVSTSVRISPVSEELDQLKFAPSKRSSLWY